MTPAAHVRGLLHGAAAIILLFLSLPTLIIVATSFTAGQIVQFPPQGLSLRWYAALIENLRFVTALTHSAEVAVFCSALTVPIGTLAALGLHGLGVRTSRGFSLFLMLPFTVPLLASGLALMLQFSEIGIVGRLWTVGLGVTIINLPLMIWSVLAAVNSLDPDFHLASQNCGARPIQTFVHITMPTVMPGVVNGALVTFILSFNEFMVSFFLVDARIMTMPVLMYSAVRDAASPDISAVSTVYVAISIMAIWAIDRIAGLENVLKGK